tara:strand:+ start:7457 stop:7684 length:228 start_codon:yes stop_codon:yes gene_type:complete
MTTKILDAKGLRCPIPVLKADKIVKKLKTGDVLKIFTTDPKSVNDFKAFCEVSNCLFQSSEKKNNIFIISICKSL